MLRHLTSDAIVVLSPDWRELFVERARRAVRIRF
jgi:hypothetical protein